MTTLYDDKNLLTIDDLIEFIKSVKKIELRADLNVKDRAIWIKKRLLRFKYIKLNRKEKGVVKEYLKLITGLKDRTIKSHIKAYIECKTIGNTYKRNCFTKKYTKEDEELLAETDNLHSRLNGIATRMICKKMFKGGDTRYKNLSEISTAHLYNLRKTIVYKNVSTTVSKTQAVNRNIGERKKPQPKGLPGFIRVDTVHQGDLNGEKGVYHINLIDEITQWDIMIAVEGISEEYLIEAIEGAMSYFPFEIINFHSDNGSEFINYRIAEMLNRMLIKQTKSRSRHSNDNGLVESKNGSIIRKHLGHWHIPRKFANNINDFYIKYMISYVNFYRPSAFPVKTLLDNGKIKISYPEEEYKTPLEKLLSLDNCEKLIKKGLSKQILLDLANTQTPNQAAKILQKEKKKLLNLVISIPKNII